MQTALVTFMLMALVVDVVMVIYAITRPDRSRSVHFAILAFGLFIYSLGYIAEIQSPTVEAATAALWVENAAIPLVAPFFLMTALSLFQPKLLRSWMLPVAFAYGMTMFMIVLFNEHHRLYYTSIRLVAGQGFNHVLLGYGPLYMVQQAVTFSCMTAAYIILFRRFIGGSSRLRKQMSLFIAGSLITFLANIINMTGIVAGIDPTPFAMTIGLIFFSFNAFRQKLLDIAMVAFNTAVETMDDALIVLDGDWGFVYCNNKAKALFPSLSTLSGSELITEAEGWPWELKPVSIPSMISFSRGNNTYRANISHVRNKRDRQVGWSVLMRDITDITQMMSKLEELAVTDSLTGISNRRQFMDTARRELSMAERHSLAKSIIMFDLDHFKRFNDTYGHLNGDKVLIAVVGAVKNELRSYDLFGRYGGEEFIIFSAGGDEDEVFGFAQRLRSAVEAIEITLDDHPVAITASFGIATIPPGSDLNAAIDTADKAMYRAKSLGRNRVVLDVTPVNALKR